MQIHFWFYKYSETIIVSYFQSKAKKEKKERKNDFGSIGRVKIEQIPLIEVSIKILRLFQKQKILKMKNNFSIFFFLQLPSIMMPIREVWKAN